MSNLKIQGTVKRVTPRNDVSKTDKPFIKRELWVEIPNGNYPQLVSFEATQDRCDLLDALQLDQGVTVHFNINGREYNDRVFNSLNIWKVEIDGAQSAAPASQAPAQASQSAPAPDGQGEPPVDEVLDLPF